MRASCSAALFGIFVAFIFIISQPAPASSIWDGGGANSNWDNRFNWTGDAAPVNDGLADIFTAGTISMSPAVNVNYDIHSLVFDNNAGAFNIFGPSILTIRSGGIHNNSTSAQTVSAPIQLAANQRWISGATSAGTLALTGSINTNPYTINTSGAGQITLSGPIAGVGGFTLDGVGTVTFSGSSSNIFAGPTTLNAGTLELLKNAGITAIAGPLVIGDGAGIDTVRVFHSDQIADTSPLTINSSGRLSLEGASDAIGSLTMNGAAAITTSGTGTLTLRGPITATGGSISGNLNLGSGAGAIIVNNASLPTADLTISAAISDTTGLTKSGNGILQFTGSAINTYTGDTTINAGTLILNRTSSAGSIPSGKIIVGDGVGTDTLDLAAPDQFTSRDIAINSSGILKGNNVANSVYIDQVTMTGGTMLDANLELGSSFVGLAGPTPATISGGSLRMREVSTTFSIADGAPADDMIITAALTGTKGITKSGPGTLRLTGSATNTTTGTSTVLGGKLILDKTNPDTAMNGPLVIGSTFFPTPTAQVQLQNISQLANSAVTVNLSGLLDMTGAQTVASLAMAGGKVSIPGASTLRVNGNLTSSTNGPSIISGGGNLEAFGNYIITNGPLDISTPIFGPPSYDKIVKQGFSSLRVSGPGTLQSYLGVEDGTVILASDAPGGAVPKDVILGDGVGADTLKLERPNQISGSLVIVRSLAVLDLNGNNDTARISFNGGGTLTTGTGVIKPTILRYESRMPSSNNLNEGKTATLQGNLDLTDNQELWIDDHGSATTELNITANIVAGPLVKTGAGALALSGNNNPDRVELNQGTIILNSNTAFGTAPVAMNAGTLNAPLVTRTLPNDITINGDVAFVGPLTLNGLLSGPGNLTKSGAGALTLAQPTTIQGAWTTNLGGISGSLNLGGISGNLTIATAGSLTQDAGTISGSLRNSGRYTYNNGAFAASLVNEGAMVVNRSLSIGGGLTNSSDISLVTSVNLSAGGSGINNTGQISLSNSTLSGLIVNDGRISGFGTISTTSSFTNNGQLTMGQGSLTLSGSGTHTNNGAIDLISGWILVLNSNLTNNATINLKNSTINGASTLFNLAGATIAGRATIFAPINNDGTIALTAGTTGIVKPFTNTGTIELTADAASLTGGKVSSSGAIHGLGYVGSDVDNTGTIEASGGMLNFSGAVNNSGSITASTGNKILFSSGLASNPGLINIAGGTFDNNGHPFTNTGEISGFGTFRALSFTNNGSITFTGGQSTITGDISNTPDHKIEVKNSPALFTGTITNNGIFKSTQAQITFSGKYIENGTFASDPADNFFNNVSIGENGAWQGGPGDRFVVSGDLLNQSTNNSAWQTHDAELRFTGGASHLLSVLGEDLGPDFAGYENNFAWGILTLAAGDHLSLQGDGALYVHELNLPDGLNQLQDISGNGLTIYYDVGQAGNLYLDGQTYLLAGGGKIQPVPEPALAGYFALGLIVLIQRLRTKTWR